MAVKTLTIYVNPDIEALREAVAGLDMPSAVFHGVHDKSATLDDTKSIATTMLKDSASISFENSGHVSFIEESTRFNSELLAFLEDRLPTICLMDTSRGMALPLFR